MEYDWGPTPLWMKVLNWVIFILMFGLAFGGLALALITAGCPMWPY